MAVPKRKTTPSKRDMRRANHDKVTPVQLADFESLTGAFLQELGYPLSSTPRHDLRSIRLRSTYLASFTARHWLKSRTPLGRFAKLERMELAKTR